MLCIDKQSPLNENRYMLHGGGIERVGSTPFQILTSRLTRILPVALLRDLFAARRTSTNDDDESVHDFFARRLHKSLADVPLSAFIHGIYGGDVKTWSMHAQFPSLVKLE